MAENVGYATLSVIPSMLGFGPTLTKGIAPEMAAAGASSGASFLSAFKGAGPTAAVVAVVVAIVATATAAIKMGTTFQESTTQLVTGAGESVASLEMVRSGLLKMAPAVAMGPEALAKAMFLVESAGYHGADGLNVMAAAAEGAKIGGASATTVANGLTTALTDYHLPASQAAEVTSKLVATVAAGKTTMEQLSGSLATVLPFAASFGVGLNDITGAMATMTSQGIGADTSAMMLKFTMMSLANEVPKGAKALDSVGLSAAKVHDSLANQGLAGTLQMITDAVGKKFPVGSAGYTHAIAAIVGGTRGMGATLALTGQNMDTYLKNIKNIGDAAVETGGHVKGWALTQEDLATRVDQVKAKLESWATSLGMTIVPWISKAMGFMSDTAMPAMEAFGGMLVDKVGPALTTVGKFITDTVVPAVAAFVKGFQDGTGAGGGFRDFLVLFYKDAIEPLATFLTGTVIPAVQSFVKGFQDGTGPGGQFRDILVEIHDKGIVPLANFITDTALPALKSIEDWIIKNAGPAFDKFKTWVGENKDGLKKIAEFITLVFLPVLVDMTVQVVVKAREQAGAWVTTKVEAIDSALMQMGAHYSTVAGWAMSAAAAIASGAETAAIWLMLKWDAVTGVAVQIGALVAVAGGWIASAATATWAGATMAAAWVVGLGPIAWIIAAVVAIGVALYEAYQHVDWFKTAVDKSWQWIKDAVAAVGHWFTTTVPEWWNSVAKSTSDIWGGIVDWFKNIPNRIMGALGDMGQLLYNAGSAIISGFWNGLKSMWTNVTGWFSGIGDWISQHKGPLSYDRQLLVPHGNAIMAGFSEGLTAGFGRVKSNLNGVAGDVSNLMTIPNVASPDFSTSEYGNPGGGGGNGGVRLHPDTVAALGAVILAGASTVSTRTTAAAQYTRTSAMSRGSR